MFNLDIYTDGSCINNPGSGGCAAIVNFKGNKKKIFKAGYYYTTNNRMELMAVILPLKYFLKFCNYININIYTDSKYLFIGITKWIYLWKKNKWKNKKKKIIKNIDLWLTLYNLSCFYKKNISWFLLKSHSGNIYNNKCDKIASFYAKKPTLNDLPFP